eukprot:TRINITY_DN93440_c0_g1_i1.p1 TRINITY_DN93440_c0_g1~~TRINITY_DN93440_c0_g1_i1.p1  ORF type:complete len:390 (-),score=51.59 TRINITY_DN93440_c0_g1_i1:44-1192(-)
MDARWHSTCAPRCGAVSKLGCFSAFRPLFSTEGHAGTTRDAPTLLTSAGRTKSRAESPSLLPIEKARSSANTSDQKPLGLEDNVPAEVPAATFASPGLVSSAAPAFPPRRVPVSSLWSSQPLSARPCSSQSSGFVQDLALVDASRLSLQDLPPVEDAETRSVELRAPRRFPPRRVAVSRLWRGESADGNINELGVEPQSSQCSSPRTPDTSQHCCTTSLMQDPTEAFASILNPVQSIQSLATKVLQTAHDTVVAFLHSLMAQKLQSEVGSSTSSARPSANALGQPNKLFNGKNRKTCIWNPDRICVNPANSATPGIHVSATMPGRGEVEAFFEWKEVEEYSFHFGRLKMYAFNSNGDLFKHEGFGQIHWEKQPQPADGTELR